MNIGDLVKHKTRVDEPFLAEVAAFWDKRDIDWECPESVAVVPMVRLIILTGENAGKSVSFRRRSFRSRFLILKEVA